MDICNENSYNASALIRRWIEDFIKKNKTNKKHNKSPSLGLLKKPQGRALLLGCMSKTQESYRYMRSLKDSNLSLMYAGTTSG